MAHRDGGYIVTGATQSFNGDVTGNHDQPAAPKNDGWIAKLDHAGILLWQKAYGGTSYDAFSTIQETTDGGYIVAGTTQSNDGDVSGNHGNADVWIIKIDHAGT